MPKELKSLYKGFFEGKVVEHIGEYITTSYISYKSPISGFTASTICFVNLKPTLTSPKTL